MLCDNQGALVEDGWSGDLRDYAGLAWLEDSDVAVVVVTIGGEARAWVNLRHVHPRERALAYMWARAQAARRPPLAVMDAPTFAQCLALYEHEAS